MSEGRGADQPRRYCTNCGSRMRSGNAYCVSCGKSVDSTVQGPPPRTVVAVDTREPSDRPQWSMAAVFDRARSWMDPTRTGVVLVGLSLATGALLLLSPLALPVLATLDYVAFVAPLLVAVVGVLVTLVRGSRVPRGLRWVVAAALCLYGAVGLYRLSLDHLETPTSRVTVGILLLAGASCGTLAAVVRPIRERLIYSGPRGNTRTPHPAKITLYAVALALAIFASPYMFVLGAAMSAVGIAAISIAVMRDALGRAITFFLASLIATLLFGVVSDILYGTGNGTELPISITVGGERLSIVALTVLVTAVVCLGSVAVLLIRRWRRVQTDFETRLFRMAGRSGRSAQKAYKDAGSHYRRWSQKQAADRKRSQLLQRLEGERERRRAELARYKRFFETARKGSQRSLDWWRAYDGDNPGENPSTSDLLRATASRAESGVERIRAAEGRSMVMLEEERFGEVDLLLEGVRKSQEDFEGEESVFPPLVAVHERIKRLEGWDDYRSELESLIKDLEDLLESPAVRTAAASRARFPEPDRLHTPGPAAARFPDPHRPTEPPRTPPVGAGAPPSDGSTSGSGSRQGDPLPAAAVAGGFAAVLLVGLVLVLTRGPTYEVVYEKDMSAMVPSMSGYDYVDHNGVTYIKVEVEDPEDIGPAYEDLATRPKVDEYDCVVVDFLVEGDRSGGIADGRIIENRPSCSEDVRYFEERMGSFSEVSETDDVFNENGVKGIKNPEEW